jgi:RNA polymerase sigma-70 factor (ECF subfamily)
VNERSDADLLRLARAGDRAAFGALAARHGRAMLGIALAVLGDLDLAEDVCQDALFRAWQRLGDCRDPDRVAAWLAVIVRRRALDETRRRPSEPLRGDPAGEGPDAHRRLEQAELGAALQAALGQLTAEQRQAVLLFDLEGWSHADIAASLGTSEAMSRQHLMLGRRRMRELLAGRNR